MDKENAALVKSKLNEIQNTLDEYGKQSDRFKKSSDEINVTIEKISELNALSKEILTKSDACVNDINKLINDDLTNDLQNLLGNTKSLLDGCIKQCEIISNYCDTFSSTIKNELDAFKIETSKGISFELSKSSRELHTFAEEKISVINSMLQSMTKDLVSGIEVATKNFEEIKTQNHNVKDAIESNSQMLLKEIKNNNSSLEEQKVSLAQMAEKIKLAVILSASSCAVGIISLIISLIN